MEYSFFLQKKTDLRSGAKASPSIFGRRPIISSPFDANKSWFRPELAPTAFAAQKGPLPEAGTVAELAFPPLTEEVDPKYPAMLGTLSEALTLFTPRFSERGPPSTRIYATFKRSNCCKDCRVQAITSMDSPHRQDPHLLVHKPTINRCPKK
jgi:hypothetical protein